MNKALILVIIAELWMTAGHICFKKSADHLNEERAGSSWLLHFLKLVLKYPLLWAGAMLMVVGLLFWFAALASGELSYVYLLGSIQYIFVLFATHLFLNEKIDATKLIGTVLITAGIILTASS